MSRLPSIKVSASLSNNIDTDIVAVFQDAGKKAIPPSGKYGECVERLRKSGAFSGNHGSIQFIRFAGKEPAENVLFIGMGNSENLTEERARVVGSHVASRLRSEKSQAAVFNVDDFISTKGLPDLHSTRLVRSFLEGFVLNHYEFQKHKSKQNEENGKSDAKSPTLFLFTEDRKIKNQLDAEVEQVGAVSEAVQVTRDWSNEPSNVGTPEFYAEEARKWGKKLGLKVTVWSEREARREKMGLFLGVGQGAGRESQFVIVEHTPKGQKGKKGLKTIALVGKGVTFDSGGISIKPSARMEDMKHDMTGAATVMGAMMLAARWNVPNRVIGIMAFVENMPDGNAIQPGNILTARNGKTVEIINTDAEGRLILADALDVAQDFKPDAVIDIATLTGAVSIALGKHCSAVLGNEQSLIDALSRAGAMSGERMWQLPLFDEYFEDLKSDTADMKNSANDSYGGTIRGAMFLKQFIRKNVHWAHLDIASTAYNMGHVPYYPKRGASGAHVRTLAQFVSDF